MLRTEETAIDERELFKRYAKKKITNKYALTMPQSNTKKTSDVLKRLKPSASCNKTISCLLTLATGKQDATIKGFSYQQDLSYKRVLGPKPELQGCNTKLKLNYL